MSHFHRGSIPPAPLSLFETRSKPIFAKYAFIGWLTSQSHSAVHCSNWLWHYNYMILLHYRDLILGVLQLFDTHTHTI